MLLSEREAELEKYRGDMELLELEYKTVENSLLNVKEKCEELQKEKIGLYEEINELHFKNTSLRVIQHLFFNIATLHICMALFD